MKNKLALGLTTRQMDILRHLAAGFSNKVIARVTDLAEDTVMVHVAAVCQILRVKNRVEAMLISERLGLTGTLNGTASSVNHELQNKSICRII